MPLKRMAGLRPGARLIPCGDGRCALFAEADLRDLRDDAVAVGGERLLLALRHQVDVELVYADRFELAQLLRRLLRRAEDAEAVADLVGDELAVLGADPAVLLVVVELPSLDEVGQG